MMLHDAAPVLRNVRYNRIKTLACSFVDPEYVFTLIRTGRGIYVIDGLEYPVQTGDMVLLPPYKKHIVYSTPGEEMEECVLHFDLFSSETAEKPPGMNFERFAAEKENPETALAGVFSFRHQVPPQLQRQVFQYYELLYREHLSGFPDTLGVLRQRAALLNVLAVFLAQEENTGAIPDSQTRNWRQIEKGISYIHKNYQHPIQLDEISRKAGISKTYFCLLFRKYTGTTIHSYINDLRLEKARKLMADPALSLTEIAAAVGIGSIHAFSKLFRKQFGETPTEFRNGIDGGPNGF